MPETDVNLNINARGGERAAAALDKASTGINRLTQLSPAITRISGGLAGLGQVARLLGDQFDGLGQSITNIGISAAGLGQLGAVFGPIGAAIGTVAGIAVGAINLISASSEQAEREDAAQLVSLAKARCSDAAILVANEAIQMHGGIGMTDEHDIGFYLKRARAAESTFGDAAWHRDRWARLRGY